MLARLHPLLRVIAIGVPVVGAVPTGMNLYQSWKHGIPYSQVAHKLEQYDLWVRNMDCPIEYKELTASQNTKITIGVCPNNGDISIKVAMPEGKALITKVFGGHKEAMERAMRGLSKTERATLTDLLKRLGTTAQEQLEAGDSQDD